MPSRILVDDQYRSGQKSSNKRKTGTVGPLWSHSCVPVSARKLLKPPCTERYARWCERTGVNHPLLLDRNRDQDCDSDRPSSGFYFQRTILWLFIPVVPFRGWFYNKQPGTACFSLNTVSLQDYFNVTSMSLQSQLQYNFKVTSKNFKVNSLLPVQLPFISCITLWYDCVDANGSYER